MENGLELMTWATFLHWLTSPTAIPLAVGALLSIAVEYLKAYNELEPKWKRAVFFALSLLVPLVGVLLGVLTLGWSMSFELTFWPAIMAGGLAFASGTLTHLRKLPDAPATGE